MSESKVHLPRCPVTGISVIHEPLSDARTVSFGLYVRNGAANETAKESGASHFLEHLVFKGDIGGGVELTEAMADLGSHVNAYTTDEHTSYYATCLPEVATETLTLLLEILRLKFTDDDVKMERSVILEEMRQYRDDPGFSVHEKGLQFFAPRHALSRPIIGTESALKRLKKSDIERFFYERYHPSRIALSIAGDTSKVDFLAVLASRANHLVNTSTEPAETSGPGIKGGPSIKGRRGLQRLSKRGILLSHLVAFWPGVSEHHPDKFALELWCDIVGAGSRFAWDLVEPGIVESAGLSCEPRLHTGYLMLNASCEAERMPEVEEKIRKILADAAIQPITEDELSQSKSMTEFSLCSGFGTPTDRMSANGEHWLTHGVPYPLEEELEAFRAVTLEQVNQLTSGFQLADAAVTILTPS